jgi:hypothetical protein
MSGWALQQALYGALLSDAGVAALVAERIFDDVPRDAALPYIVIGADTQSDWSTATESGSVHSLVLDVWSRAAGHHEVKQICDAVRAALDGAALAVSGFHLVDLRFESARTARQSDGRTYRAMLNFRAVLEPQE